MYPIGTRVYLRRANAWDEATGHPAGDVLSVVVAGLDEAAPDLLAVARFDGVKGGHVSGAWFARPEHLYMASEDAPTAPGVPTISGIEGGPDGTPSTASPALPDDSNPKDAIARQKVDLSLISPVAQVHIADALMDGAAKYDPYNWRDKKVQARVYLAAAMRHLNQWAMGEELADDSGVHHLGHAAACMVILLDAQAHGCLLDNRAKGIRLQELHDSIQARRAPPVDSAPNT